MKAMYQHLVLDITSLASDVVTTSELGWQEGDNDVAWDNGWTSE